MSKDSNTNVETTKESVLQKVNSLIKSTGEESFVALNRKIKDAQRSIEVALRLSRDRANEKARLMREEAEKQRKEEAEKKAIPVPAVDPAPVVKEEKPVAVEPIKEEKKVETPAPVEKKENVRVLRIDPTPAPKPTPSFVRGMYTPPPVAQPSQASYGQKGQKPAFNKGQQGTRPQNPRQQGQNGASAKPANGATRPQGATARPSVGAKLAPMPIAPTKDRKAFDKKKDFNKRCSHKN